MYRMGDTETTKTRRSCQLEGFPSSVPRFHFCPLIGNTVRFFGKPPKRWLDQREVPNRFASRWNRCSVPPISQDLREHEVVGGPSRWFDFPRGASRARCCGSEGFG